MSPLSSSKYSASNKVHLQVLVISKQAFPDGHHDSLSPESFGYSFIGRDYFVVISDQRLSNYQKHACFVNLSELEISVKMSLGLCCLLVEAGFHNLLFQLRQTSLRFYSPANFINLFRLNFRGMNSS